MKKIISERLKKAINVWADFINEIIYKNRFLERHKVLGILKKSFSKRTIIVEAGTIFYRARKYGGNTDFVKYLDGPTLIPNESLTEALYAKIFGKNEAIQKVKSGFYGFNAKDSFVPPKNIVKDGRANPSYISYLYVAERPYTAMVEVQPYLGSDISVAEIKVNRKLNIMDIAKRFNDLETIEDFLLYFIAEEFSKPVDDDIKSYIPTQYIAEYLKREGFDGIRFRSSLDKRGSNITIFNYNECETINSKLYKLNDICLDADSIAAPEKSKLCHYRLIKSPKRLGEEIKSLMKPSSKND